MWFDSTIPSGSAAPSPDADSTPYDQTFAYAKDGNITSFNGTAYTYGDTAHKHAVTAAGRNTYSYDANGNMTSRAENGVNYTQQFDTESRLVSVTRSGQGKVTTTFVYDGNGQRVKQTVKRDTTLYFGSYYEKGPDGTITKYYYFNGQRVAERRGTTLYYLYGDHLGSTSTVTDGGGANPVRQGYFPYGATRYATGTIPTDYGFTGQRLDAATGLMYYGARYYDAALGRFIQPDSMVPY